MNDEMERAVREAILLNDRMRASSVRGGEARLLELSVVVEEALSEGMDGEQWARAALTLVAPFMMSSRFQEIGYYLQRAIELAEGQETRTWAMIFLGRWQHVYRHMDASEATWRDLGAMTMAPLQRVYCNYNAAKLYAELGGLDKAEVYLEEGLAIARRDTFARGICMTLQGMGSLALVRGTPRQALRFFEEAYELNRQQLREPQIELSIGSGLGTTYMSLREYTRAMGHMRRVRERAMESGMMVHSFNAWSVELTMALALGRYEDVVSGCAQLREQMWARDTFNAEFRLVVLEAVVAALKEPRQEALVAVTAALELVLKSGDPTSVCAMRMLSHVLAPESHDLPEYVSSMILSADLFALLGGASGDEARAMEEGLNVLESDILGLARPRCWALHAEEGFWRVSMDGREWVDLRRRANARALLQTLHASHPDPVGSWELFEKVWPEVEVRDDRVLGRLYTCIYRLRGLGLDGVVLSAGQSYRLSGPVQMTAPREV